MMCHDVSVTVKKGPSITKSKVDGKAQGAERGAGRPPQQKTSWIEQSYHDQQEVVATATEEVPLSCTCKSPGGTCPNPI